MHSAFKKPPPPLALKRNQDLQFRPTEAVGQSTRALRHPQMSRHGLQNPLLAQRSFVLFAVLNPVLRAGRSHWRWLVKACEWNGPPSFDGLAFEYRVTPRSLLAGGGASSPPLLSFSLCWFWVIFKSRLMKAKVWNWLWDHQNKKCERMTATFSPCSLQDPFFPLRPRLLSGPLRLSPLSSPPQGRSFIIPNMIRINSE